MTKSIKPNCEIFQYAIKYLPTGKYLKKPSSGGSFYETDIPSVYNSPKVAMKSLETAAQYTKFKPNDCKIVKFRLIMEEVAEEKDNEFEKALNDILLARKVLGEIHWDEVEDETEKKKIMMLMNDNKTVIIHRDSSFHCISETISTSSGIFKITWAHNQNLSDGPISICEQKYYNWNKLIDELKTKYGK